MSTLKIAPQYKVADWERLALDPAKPASPDWQKAVDMFSDRIAGRFFAPADQLLAAQKDGGQTFGFAILAIDCLVIETLQGFREGVVNHTGQSKKLFVNFLKDWDLFKICLPQGGDADALAREVYGDCRCALLHSGSTQGFRVGTSGPAFAYESGRLAKINRTKFHKGLREEFDAYLAALLETDNAGLRKNFRKKMDAICSVV